VQGLYSYVPVRLRFSIPILSDRLNGRIKYQSLLKGFVNKSQGHLLYKIQGKKVLGPEPGCSNKEIVSLSVKFILALSPPVDLTPK
jgi:hypothetical protein